MAQPIWLSGCPTLLKIPSSVFTQSFLGRKCDNYPGFQPKITPAQKYAIQCIKINSYLQRLIDYIKDINSKKLL